MILEYDEMVEQAAKAIYEKNDVWSEAFPWPNLDGEGPSTEDYREIARAALNAAFNTPGSPNLTKSQLKMLSLCAKGESPFGGKRPIGGAFSNLRFLQRLGLLDGHKITEKGIAALG